jgi:HEAT repeat protein
VEPDEGRSGRAKGTTTPPDHLRRIAERLRGLAHRRPSAEERAEVEGYLFDKWQGLQAVAARTLGTWGDAAAVRALRDLLLRSYAHEHWWTIRGVAAEALGACVGEEDVPWVLDHFFGVAGNHRKHELLPLVSRLPVAAARARLEAELRAGTPDNRLAALKAITRMPFPDRLRLLEPLVDDPDEAIRRAARSWVEHLSGDPTRPPGRRTR